MCLETNLPVQELIKTFHLTKTDDSHFTHKWQGFIPVGSMPSIWWTFLFSQLRNFLSSHLPPTTWNAITYMKMSGFFLSINNHFIKWQRFFPPSQAFISILQRTRYCSQNIHHTAELSTHIKIIMSVLNASLYARQGFSSPHTIKRCYFIVVVFLKNPITIRKKTLLSFQFLRTKISQAHSFEQMLLKDMLYLRSNTGSFFKKNNPDGFRGIYIHSASHCGPANLKLHSLKTSQLF